MIRKQIVQRVSIVAFIALLSACADAASPTAPSPDASLAAQGGQDRLAAWFDHASPAVLALPGAVFADHDEKIGKLVFGVENANAIPGIRIALAKLGVPSSAYEMEVTEPIYQMATLRDVFRPTQAGIQIHFGQYLCTMGFNVSHAGGRSFITNSHCTNRQGGVEGTQYYQPSSGVNGTVIATEAADPNYSRGGTCPKGKRCRYSDASRALYSSNVASNQGDILKTTGANNGSLTVGGVFTVSSQDNSTTNFPLGTVVNKVGRTTGWTQGQVTRTCVHTGVQGTSIAQLCQTFVSNPAGAVVVGSGDSGSPVFRITSGDNVQLVGILWGGSSDNRTFIFSPLKQIQDELGAVTATQ
ncbi:MAG TPA: hypothetical protein VJ650_06650 [Gemmatimonadaceae bacterium]|nr:hypothetical protein [Gemmatimonadaceae bacterium]